MDKRVQMSLKNLVAERNWDIFHTPENLSKSICIEASELLECFQWGADYSPDDVKSELSDVLTYAYLLCMKLELAPEEIILEKLEETKQKYPVEKSFGVSTKYDKI